MGFNSGFKGLIVNATMISTNLSRTEVHLQFIQKFSPCFKEKSLRHKYKPELVKIIVLCCESHKREINTICWQNADVLGVPYGNTCSYLWAL